MSRRSATCRTSSPRVALPSLVLYPSLVDASERARRQLIESRYAPEVTNQRPDLHTKLQKALTEIDRIVALDDLVRASDPPLSGPPPSDAAFLVWSQTSLATEIGRASCRERV